MAEICLSKFVSVQRAKLEAVIGAIDPLPTCLRGLTTDDLHRLGGRGLRTLRNQARHQLPMVMGLPGSNQKNQHVTALLFQAGGHRQ